MFGFGIPELIVLLVILAPFVLWVVALVDIIRSDFVGNNKLIWIIVVVLLPLLGAILYFLVGRKQKVNSACSAIAEDKEKFCSECGNSISPRAEICPQCGVRQQVYRSNSRSPVAIVLIVVAIGFGCVAGIGILAAIAVPQFSAYRVKAYDSAAQSDLKNAKTAVEAYFADHQEYPESLKSTSFQPSQNVEVSYERTAKGSYYIITEHKSGKRQFGSSSESAVLKWRAKEDQNAEFVPL